MQQLAHGPIEVVIGLSFGIGWGILLMFIPHKDDVSIHYNLHVIHNNNIFPCLDVSLLNINLLIGYVSLVNIPDFCGVWQLEC